MNLLAHLHLGRDLGPIAAAGNFSADFCESAGSPQFDAGIQFHRAIDAYTDAHPLVAGCQFVRQQRCCTWQVGIDQIDDGCAGISNRAVSLLNMIKVDGANEAALLGAIGRLAENTGLRRKLGEEASANMRSQFSPQSIERTGARLFGSTSSESDSYSSAPISQGTGS